VFADFGSGLRQGGMHVPYVAESASPQWKLNQRRQRPLTPMMSSLSVEKEGLWTWLLLSVAVRTGLLHGIAGMNFMAYFGLRVAIHDTLCKVDIICCMLYIYISIYCCHCYRGYLVARVFVLFIAIINNIWHSSSSGLLPVYTSEVKPPLSPHCALGLFPSGDAALTAVHYLTKSISVRFDLDIPIFTSDQRDYL
jgi:hypothetical protein